MIVIIQPVGVGEAVLEARFPRKSFHIIPNVDTSTFEHTGISDIHTTREYQILVFYFPFQYEKDQLSNCLAISCVQDR